MTEKKRPLPPPNAVPILIRGQLFPSMLAASKHFGVAASSISTAADRGTLDNVGLGLNYRTSFILIHKGKEYSIRQFCKKYELIYGTWVDRIRKAYNSNITELDTPAGKITLKGKRN